MEARTAAERTLARRRALYWLVVAGALVVAAAVVARRSQNSASSAATAVKDPLALVPPGPVFVLTVDAARLRASALGSELIGKSLERLDRRAPEHASASCKVLLAKLDRLAVSVPAGGGGGASSAGATSFGVVGSGRFFKSTVLDCARASEGGSDAVATTIGSFDTLHVPGKSGELAARDGLFVVSDGEYFRALLDRAEGHVGRASPGSEAQDRLHAELRHTIARDAPIVATLALEPGWLAHAVADPEAERSPLAGLRAAALRATVTTELEVTGLLACGSSDDAARVDQFFTNLKSDLRPLAKNGALSLLTKLTLGRRDAELDFSGKLGLTELEALAPTPAPAPSR